MPGKVVRGTVLDVSLDPTVGHEQQKTRPCVVIQNNIGNKYSPTSIVAVITGAENVQRTFPVTVPVKKGDGGLRKDSVVLCNQIRAVDEMRFGRVYGQFSAATMRSINDALKISLALT
jgi:mRNA interferase MazF